MTVSFLPSVSEKNAEITTEHRLLTHGGKPRQRNCLGHTVQLTSLDHIHSGRHCERFSEGEECCTQAERRESYQLLGTPLLCDLALEFFAAGAQMVCACAPCNCIPDTQLHPFTRQNARAREARHSLEGSQAAHFPNDSKVMKIFLDVQWHHYNEVIIMK